AIGVKEMIDGVPYVVAGLVFAFVSVRRSAVVVGVFWLLRGLYDLAHSQFITNTGVAGWYPVFCFVVDAVVGSYLLWLSRRVPDATLRQAQVEALPPVESLQKQVNALSALQTHKSCVTPNY
ncbi:MAG: hypothetical protein IPI27_10820, partial [Betaproteobacteria bacterium]|nr:hypothetical protein [Betaproteobacteria bacterium]